MNPLDVFREALVWHPSEQVARFDMDLARSIHRDRLRAMRAPLLAALDIRIRDALMDQDWKHLGPERVLMEDLRKVTIYGPINAAQTIEELQDAVPKCLIDHKV